MSDERFVRRFAISHMNIEKMNAKRILFSFFLGLLTSINKPSEKAVIQVMISSALARNIIVLGPF